MPPDMKKAPAPGKEPSSGKHFRTSEDHPQGQDLGARHPYGPRQIGALLPAVTRPVFRKQSPATAAMATDWPSIVGPKLAAVTQPRRLAAGTLTLGCIGPVALELQHLAGPLMERINAHLGRALVQRLRFVQDATAPSPSVRTQRPPPRPDPVPVPGLPPGELRDALAALGAMVLAERA